MSNQQPLNKVKNNKLIKLLSAASFGAITLNLVACGSTASNDDTLEALESKIVIVQEERLPSASTKDAEASYQEFLKSTNNQELRARALERLTDLQLENKQSEEEALLEKQVTQAFEPQTSVSRKPEPETQKKQSKSGVEQAVSQLQVPPSQAEKLAEQKQKTAKPQSIPAPVPMGAGAKAAPAGDMDYDTDGDYLSVAKQYEDLLKRNPNSKDNERILYQLARAYDLAGEMDKSLSVLTRLVKEFPNTKNIEEVQFRRGEILFSKKSYSKAVGAYRVILNNRKSEYYERAIYKHGWSLFKLNKYDQALTSFYRLLDFKFKGGQQFADLSRSEREVLEDTFRVISVTFSFQEGAKSIASFSKKHGKRNYEFLIYKQLGDLYLSQDRNEDAASVYIAYINRFPDSANAPKFSLAVIDIYKQGGFPTKLTKAKADFVTRYGIGKRYWKKQDDKLYAEISPHIKSNLTELSEHYHAIGQKSKKKKDYETAAFWYRDYVRSFPGEPETAKMNFLLAEVLQESGDLADAALEFENTAYNYKIYEKSAEAGYAAILAHQQQIKKLQGRALEEKRKEAITSALNFADHFPQDLRVPPVLIKVAEEFTDLKQYKDAATVARRLTVSLDPQQQVAKQGDKQPKEDPKLKDIRIRSWAILANAEFELQNYKEAELATLKRLRLVDAKTDKDREVHVERLAAAVYKQGESAQKSGDLSQAADHYLRVASLAPTSTIRVTAEYDAAVVLAQAKLWDKAIPVINRFIQLYPNHKNTKAATETLAVAYVNTGKLTNAAATYALVYKHETDPERKRQLVWQTAETYEEAKKKKNAIDVYKQYVQLYPEPLEQAEEARLIIADYYGEQKQNNMRQHWLGEIVRADDVGKSTERTKFLAANASLELAEPTYKEYKSVSLVLPLKPNLKKKKQLLEQSIDAYTKAANYGVAAVTTASTYRIAEIYNDFSVKLFDSEKPKGLSEDELEQYELLLEEQAYPFEEKAIEIHETNANRAYEGIYDQWVQKSFKELGKLRPVRYAKNERSELLSNVIN